MFHLSPRILQAYVLIQVIYSGLRIILRDYITHRNITIYKHCKEKHKATQNLIMGQNHFNINLWKLIDLDKSASRLHSGKNALYQTN